MTRLKVLDGFGDPKKPAFEQKQLLDEARLVAMDSLYAGQTLGNVITEFVYQIESMLQDCRIMVSQFTASTNQLCPIAAPSLPAAILDIYGCRSVTDDQSSCAAAVVHQRPVIIEDLPLHASWQQLKHVAMRNQLTCCWSWPLHGDEGSLGTMAIYWREPCAPNDLQRHVLDYCARQASLILQCATKLTQHADKMASLEAELAEQRKLHGETQRLLEKAVMQRNEVRAQMIELENMAALGTMMSSLTHELNTPVGIAITASSFMKAAQATCAEKLKQGLLKRSELDAFFASCGESSDIIERNLLRATQIVGTFKQLSNDQHSQEKRKFVLIDYVGEVLLSLKPKLKRTKLTFCLDIDTELAIESYPGALGQILINLIANSIEHAYLPDQVGHIDLRARLDDANKTLTLVYQDDGKGMDDTTQANMYKPFFTLARDAGGSGLGMHICYNLAVNFLGGSIECDSHLGGGAKFTVTLPLTE